MDVAELKSMIERYFPGSQLLDPHFHKTAHGELVLKTLIEMDGSPIGQTRFNQVLHLLHEAGVSDGFFTYYFLEKPESHPYPVDKVIPCPHAPSTHRISSMEQLEWGGKRFIQDALLRFGNIRAAFVALRTMSYDDLKSYFAEERFDPDKMSDREATLELKHIGQDDRHLVAELAANAYAVAGTNGAARIEQRLRETYRAKGGGVVAIRDLLNEDLEAMERGESQGVLDFLSEDVINESIDDESAITDKIRRAAERWNEVQSRARHNTRLFLSIANELDVYVATSMRGRKDFRYMATECEKIFATDEVAGLNLRYFDPTISAAEVSEDKGLLECLMVKCAKVILYFAGEKDSYGKDAEAAMALSLGKPVIIVCPSDTKGEKRSKFFRDIHPLSRLIEFETGVACGAIVTNESGTAAKILGRIFRNKQEYDLEHDGKGYFRLRERLTRSVVRLQTNDAMIRETFWSYYGARNQGAVRPGPSRGLGTWQPR